MQVKSKILVILMLFVFLLSPGALPVATAAEPVTLSVALSYAPKFLCMNYDYDGANYFILPNIMSKLVDFSVNMEIIGDLAEKWTISDDGLKYTFYLVKNAKWHDGEPFTAEDVVWTVESMKEHNGYGKASVAGVTSVKALDKHTVEFVIEEPNSSFLADLARRYGFTILPKHLYKDEADPRQSKYHWAPVGTGPFKFVELVPGSYVALEANKEYYGGAPAIDRLIFRFFPDMSSATTALEAGDIDVMATTPPFTDAIRLQKNPAFKVGIRPTEIPVWLAFNLSKKPFDDVRVRQALGHAINRDEINRLVYQGQLKPADTVYVSTIAWACNPNAKQPEFDLKKAEALLDEAGYTKDKNGIRFTSTYTGFKAAVWGAKEIGDVLKVQLARIGVNLKLEYLDYAVFSEKILRNKDYDISWSGGPHGPDPQAFAQFVGTGGNRNAMGYSNLEVDKLFQVARLSLEEDDQKKAYFTLQEIVGSDLPRLALIEWSYLHPHKATFEGFCWEEGIRAKCFVDSYRFVSVK